MFFTCFSLFPAAIAQSLVTHALLQCPFVSQEVAKVEVQAPSAPAGADSVTEIRQGDISNGPYVIRAPGTYVVKDDLFFNFRQPDISAGFWETGLHAGKVNGIEIVSDNVILDLDGHTLAQDVRHFKRQRFFNLVVIGNQPFPKGMGGYTSALTPQKKIVIKNGNFGYTSHFAIRGHGTEDVLIEDCVFRNFEVAAVSFHSSTRIAIQNCDADNEEFELTVGINFAIFFQLYRTMKWAEYVSSKFPPSDGFPDAFLNDPLAIHLNGLQGLGSRNRAAQEFMAKEGKFAIGNVYGLAQLIGCQDVLIDEVNIHNVHSTGGRVKAVQDLTGIRRAVLNVDENALLCDWFWDDDGKRIDNKPSMTELEAFKVLSFKAQVWTMKKAGVYFPRFLERVTPAFVNAVLDPSKPEIPDIKCWLGADIRSHPDHGLSAITIKGNSHHVKISNVKISTLSNADSTPLQLHTPKHTWDVTDRGELLNEPNVWRGPRFSHQIAHMADAYGIRISSSHDVSIHNIEIKDISSEKMHAFGVAVTGSCRNIGVEDAVVGGSVSGGMDAATQIPLLKAKGMPYFWEQEQENVGFARITPEQLYCAPSQDCVDDTSSEGCPVDGMWDRTECPIPRLLIVSVVAIVVLLFYFLCCFFFWFNRRQTKVEVRPKQSARSLSQTMQSKGDKAMQSKGDKTMESKGGRNVQSKGDKAMQSKGAGRR